MKKKNLKNLTIKKITISKIGAGLKDPNGNPILVFSIGARCTQPERCEPERVTRWFSCNGQGTDLC